MRIMKTVASAWYRQLALEPGHDDAKSASHERMRREFIAFFDQLSRALPVVQGVVLFVASVIVGINAAVDVLYGVLDPRIRYD